MTDKLTPRQNELITEALCGMAQTCLAQGLDNAPEKLKELRRALVNECEAVTAETNLTLSSSDRSVVG